MGYWCTKLMLCFKLFLHGSHKNGPTHYKSLIKRYNNSMDYLTVNNLECASLTLMGEIEEKAVAIHQTSVRLAERGLSISIFR